MQYEKDIPCSFYYTVSPPLNLIQHADSTCKSAYYNGLHVECEKCTNGKIKVRRILSSDPMDYLKNSSVIGMEIDPAAFLFK